MEKNTILGYPEDPPLYSKTIWIISLADLYMVLLVFFIMLSSVSNSDKAKQKKAVQSINKSFSKFYKDNLNLDANAINPEQVTDKYFNSIDAVVKAFFPPEGLFIAKDGDKMEVSVNLNDFFDENGAIKHKQLTFLKQLSEILNQTTQGVAINSDIIIDVADISIQNQDYQADIDRFKAVADNLVKGGVVYERIGGGVEFAGSGKIVIKFNVISVK
jgi:hypothetical protein